MVNITHKSSTLRKAVATAVLEVSKAETISLIEQRKIPKGDIFEFSRAAGLLAIKKTSDVIPDCHPLPVEFSSITFKVEDLAVVINVEVHTIYKTGVEVEAMHGAAVTALVIYDMLKPVDKGVVIKQISLLSKTGGKTDIPVKSGRNSTCAVIVCSDTRSTGENTDTSGKFIVEQLRKYNVECGLYTTIPDDIEKIQSAAREAVAEKFDLVIFTGGTGTAPSDVTPEAIEPLLERKLPGIMETARNYGQERTRYSMLSRGLAGMIGSTLILTFPGSRKAVEEYMNALFPQVLHVLDLQHENKHP